MSFYSQISNPYTATFINSHPTLREQESVKAKAKKLKLINSKLPKMGYVYFILDSLNKSIKIGYSGDLNQRLSQLRKSNPNLTLIAHMEGSRKAERKLHKMFSASALGQEYFRITPTLLLYIKLFVILDALYE